MATILAIILAVVLDLYARSGVAPAAVQNMRKTTWLNTYLVKCIKFLDKISIKQTFVIVLCTILPLCLGLFLAKLLLGMLLGERVGQFLFTAITLFYFLGNNEFDAEENNTLVISHETSFGVLFWYAVLGFSGAFLYWFFTLARNAQVMNEAINSNLRQAVVFLHALAAWIPARITGFIYALMGNFDPGFKCWINCVSDVKMPSSQVLTDCGKASIAAGDTNDVVRLVNRTFIAWVVLVIVVVML